MLGKVARVRARTSPCPPPPSRARRTARARRIPPSPNLSDRNRIPGRTRHPQGVGGAVGTVARTVVFGNGEYDGEFDDGGAEVRDPIRRRFLPPTLEISPPRSPAARAPTTAPSLRRKHADESRARPPIFPPPRSPSSSASATASSPRTVVPPPPSSATSSLNPAPRSSRSAPSASRPSWSPFARSGTTQSWSISSSRC